MSTLSPRYSHGKVDTDVKTSAASPWGCSASECCPTPADSAAVLALHMVLHDRHRVSHYWRKLCCCCITASEDITAAPLKQRGCCCYPLPSLYSSQVASTQTHILHEELLVKVLGASEFGTKMQRLHLCSCLLLTTWQQSIGRPYSGHVLYLTTAYIACCSTMEYACLNTAKQQKSAEQHSTAQHGTAQHSVPGRSGHSGETHLPPAVDDDNGDAHEDAAQHCQGNADGQHCVQGGGARPVQVGQGCLDIPDACPSCCCPAAGITHTGITGVCPCAVC